MATMAVNYEADERRVSGRERYGYRLRPIPNEDIRIFTKAIDNSRVARQADSSARWSAVKFITSSFAVAVVLVAILVPQAWSIVAGYRYESLKQEHQRLMKECIQLEVEEAVLLSTGNLEELARQRNFEAPAPDRVFYLDGKSVLSAGRR